MGQATAHLHPRQGGRLLRDFVNLRPEGPELYVVPSRVVARNVRVVRRRASTWYSFVKQERYRDAWHLLR